MAEKLYQVGWNFVELKCGYTHYNERGKAWNPPMEIKEGLENRPIDLSNFNVTTKGVGTIKSSINKALAKDALNIEVKAKYEAISPKEIVMFA